MILRTGILLLSGCFSFLANAGELIESQISRMDGHYLIHMVMHIYADRDDVYRTLMDFDAIPQINNSFTESTTLESNGHRHRVYLVSEGCVLFICETLEQVQIVTELGRGYIMTITDPEQSDLTYGHVLWHVQATKHGTRVTYSGDFVPGFWVPPVFGPAALEDRLLKEGIKTINGIESLLNGKT